MPTTPWHSTASTLYHSEPDCQRGKQVRGRNRRNGTGDRRHCRVCKKIEEQRKILEMRRKARQPSQPRIDPEFVAERLGLSPAQSRVAIALSAGKTVSGIAKETGRTSNTVRWLLRQINRKLDISTQTQLVRLVLLLPRGPAAKRDPGAEAPGP